MKAYKVELLVIDTENTGESQIVELLENTRYIYPQVKDVKCVDIGEWGDDHLLNKRETHQDEYNRLFDISDEEIKKVTRESAINYSSGRTYPEIRHISYANGFLEAIKWYREQLKKKQ